MGAAASVEMAKPHDASDISSTNLHVARDEVIRLRALLGQYARQAGFNDVVYDASDLVLGECEIREFQRCIDEVIYIRSALRLSTQKAKRNRRAVLTNIEEKKWDEKHEHDGENKDDDSSTGSDSD
jgi:hypothetical protein